VKCFETAIGKLSRRNLLTGVLATTAGLLLAGNKARLQIGTMDTVLKLAGKPEAIQLAKELDLAALQVTLGVSADGKTLPLEDPELQRRYVHASEQHKIPIDSTYLNMLHVSCLKSDPNAKEWVSKGIEITKNLRSPILMTVFFGKCAVLNRTELDYVIDAFRELTSAAERAGVILGFENTLPGADNRYAVDRIASAAFQNLVRRGKFDLQRLRRTGRNPNARPRANLPISFQGQGLPG
jgi:hypothetical protein